MEEEKTKDLLAIFFDLDNTLIPTRSADAIACNKVANVLIKKYSVQSDRAFSICKKYLESFRKCPDNYQFSLQKWRQKLWTKALGDEYECLTEQIYNYWLELRYEYLALTHDVKKLLKTLRREFVLGLITNGPSNAQWEKVNNLNLKGYFDVILISGDLPWEKPNEKIFFEACDTLGIEPQHCIMIGDKLETDILGAISSKLGGSVWIPLNENRLSQSDPVPDYVIQNVLELPAVLPQVKNDLRCRNDSTFLVSQELMVDIEDANSNGSDGR